MYCKCKKHILICCLVLKISKSKDYIYFDELEGGDGWKPLEIRVVERAGRVRGVATGDAVDDALRGGCPVRGCKCEAVVGAGVQRIHLLNKQVGVIFTKLSIYSWKSAAIYNLLAETPSRFALQPCPSKARLPHRLFP